jgi:phage-related protein
MSIATAAIWLFNTALLANPITWIVLLIVGLIATFIYLYTNVEWVTNGVNGFFTWLKDTFMFVVNEVKKGISDLVASFMKFYNDNKAIIDLMIAVFSWLGQAFFTYVVWQIKFGIDFLVGIFLGLYTYVKDTLYGLIQMATGIVQVLVGIFTGDAEMIKTGFVNIFKGMANQVFAILNGISDFAERMVNGVIGGINSAIGMFNKIPGVNISANIGNIDIPKIPSLAIGTNEVLSDGLANIHKGEMIVPANVVKGGFNANGMSGGQNVTINIDASNSVNPDGFEREIINKIDYAFGQVKGAR